MIMKVLKQGIIRFARFWATPLRKAKQRKYAETAPSCNHLELPNEKLLPVVRQVIAEGHTAIISVKGFSMRPFLEHLRDKVKLAPVRELHIADVVLAEISPGLFVLHRIIAMDGDRITLMGDGNIQGTEHCLRSDVCGIVTEYIRPGGHILLASDPKLQRRIRLWRLCLPVRRVLLFFYKLTV